MGGLVAGLVCGAAYLVKGLALVRGVKHVDAVRVVQSTATILGAG